MLEEMKSGQESFEDDPDVENEYATDEPEPEPEEEGEPEQDDEGEEDSEKEGEEDPEKKEAAAFDDQKGTELDAMKTELASYKQIMERPDFQKFLSDKIDPDNQQELMTEFPKDLKIEELDEKDLLQMTSEIAENRMIQKMEPVFSKLQEQVNTLLGNESKKEGDAFFADNKNEFAAESKEAITNLTKKGLTYPQAYQAVCGEKIAKSEYQRGLSLNKTKKGKEVHLKSTRKGEATDHNRTAPDTFEEAVIRAGGVL